MSSRRVATWADRLPTEILDSILEHIVAATDDLLGKDIPSDFHTDKKVVKTLKSAALVCRAWRALAQPLMWKSLFINGQHHQRDMHAMLGSILENPHLAQLT